MKTKKIWENQVLLDKNLFKIKTVLKQQLEFFANYFETLNQEEIEVKVRFNKDQLLFQVFGTEDVDQESLSKEFNNYIEFILDPSFPIQDVEFESDLPQKTQDTLIAEIENSRQNFYAESNKKLKVDNDTLAQILKSSQINFIDMSTNITGSQITNSGVLNFGSLVGNVENKIENIVSPGNKHETELLEIQTNLQEILQILKTDTEISPEDKESALREVEAVANHAPKSFEDTGSLSQVKRAIQSFTGIISFVVNNTKLIELATQLGKHFGLGL